MHSTHTHTEECRSAAETRSRAQHTVGYIDSTRPSSGWSGGELLNASDLTAAASDYCCLLSAVCCLLTAGLACSPHSGHNRQPKFNAMHRVCRLTRLAADPARLQYFPAALCLSDCSPITRTDIEDVLRDSQDVYCVPLFETSPYVFVPSLSWQIIGLIRCKYGN